MLRQHRKVLIICILHNNTQVAHENLFLQILGDENVFSNNNIILIYQNTLFLKAYSWG